MTNEEIAIKVFGWTEKDGRVYPPGHRFDVPAWIEADRPGYMKPNPEYVIPGVSYTGDLSQPRVLDYMKDGEDAFKVLKALVDKGADVLVLNVSGRYFVRTDYNDFLSSTSLPEAICLAALAYVD